MRPFELVEKGQSNILVTTDRLKNEGTLTVYEMVTDSNGDLTITDITESDPVYEDIANGTFVRYNLTVPDKDCYVLCILNDKVQFFRVGVPTLRIFGYFNSTGKTISYKLLNFDGTTSLEGDMTDLGHGVYYVTPTDIGDYIFTNDKTPAFPVHTPYIVDTVGMSGKIVFQKDNWMMLGIPKKDTRISDVVAGIEDKYNVNGSDIFRIFNAYPSTDSQSKEMLDFKPGVTPVNTKYNFQLVYQDGNAFEISGFWVKTLNYDLEALNAGTSTELVTYEWHA